MPTQSKSGCARFTAAIMGKYYMRKVAQIIESGILPLDKIVTDVIPAPVIRSARPGGEPPVRQGVRFHGPVRKDSTECR